MNDRRSQKQTLETLGRDLIKNSAIQECEIDEIVGRTELFSKVLKRIDSDRTGVRPGRTHWWSIMRYRVAVGSMAAAAFVAFVGLYAASSRTGIPVTGNVSNEPALATGSSSQIGPNVTLSGFTAGRASGIESDISTQSPVPQQAIYRPARESSPSVQRASTRSVPDAEFYAVTYMGDGGESARGGRVIRVDIPRSTLFAMGMNVPLENESPTVKADLLIGPDGVTRAIRIVE